MWTCHRLCSLLCLVLLSAGLAFSQAVTAALTGTVSDISGGMIAGANVHITETNTGISRSSHTNESGNYTFPHLPPGTYKVIVETPGFKTEARLGIAVAVNTTARVDFQLAPGNVSESIEVTASAPLLQTDRADTGASVQAVQLQNLPFTVNRNFQSLLDLIPGTTPPTFNNSQFYNAAGALSTQSNGQLKQGNSYQIEGIDNNGLVRNQQFVIPPAEAIQTVDVSTSNHDAELGYGGGAMVNVILKSGTNDVHGAAYEYLQNNAMNARAFFNPSVGHIAYNYVGGNIGGPIRKNRLFLFMDYLRVMDHEANTNRVSVPSAAFRAGNFSAVLPKTVIYNPFTGNPDGTGRTPFPGNQIPSSLITQISTKLSNLLPLPNLPYSESNPTNNYFALLSFQKITDSFDIKVDENLTDVDRLSVRLSYSRPSIFQAPIFGDAGGPAQSAFEGTGLQRAYSGGINYVRAISPTLVTEARAGVLYYNNIATPSDYGKNDAADIGIPGVNISPANSGMVGINIAGFSSSPLIGYGAGLPWVRAETTIGFSNTWTKMAGNHTIRFGADLRRFRWALLQLQTYSLRGLYTFSNNQTSIPNAATGIANAFASFLLDVPSKVGRDLSTYFPGMRLWQSAAFISDRWQVSPKLTVSAGLRWDFTPPATEPYPGGFSNYNPSNNTLVIGGMGGNPENGGVQTHYKNFAPRLGAAYRLTPSTVIRTGFGITYGTLCTNTTCQEFNYPVKGNNGYLPAGNSPYLPALLPSGQVATFALGMPAPNPIPIPADGIITNPDPTSSYTVTPPNLKIYYVEAWNAAVQRALGYGFTLDLAYVGSHGVNVPSSPDLNAGLIIGAGGRGQPLYPRLTSTRLWSQGHSSSYNALQVKLDRRFGIGPAITTAFTWQKAMNLQSGDDGQPVFYINPQRNWARADFDRTLNFVQSYVYEPPFGKQKHWLTSGPAAAILGGWQLSGILSLRSGTPLTITANAASLNLPTSTQTADQVAAVEILHGIGNSPWFSTSSFAQPTGPRFGTSGRNIFSGPGIFGLNGAVSRRISVTERWRLEVRGEAFNLTNTPQFGNPAVSLTSANFGRITSTLGSGTGVNGTGGGRAVELAAKVTF